MVVKGIRGKGGKGYASGQQATGKGNRPNWTVGPTGRHGPASFSGNKGMGKGMGKGKGKMVKWCSKTGTQT